MDDKRAIAANAQPQKEADFPPYSLCGSVPLRHLHNRVKPATDALSANPLLATSPPLLVYDGSCGFCSRAVQFILRHEQRDDLCFVPRDSPLGQSLRRQFHLEQVESLLWIADGQAAIESNAVLRAAKYLGGFWALLSAMGSLVPSPLRDWGYRFVARNRRKFASAQTICLTPSAEQRTRFLS
jgi:predicted DCC family thiol-disulfide oxidoreductase YuxK